MAKSQAISPPLAKLIEAAAQPVYLVDDEGWIVAANAACAQWTGLPLEQLLRIQCVYHSGVLPEGTTDWGAALCPPPEAFDGRAMFWPLAWKDAGGAVQRCQAQFVGLRRSREVLGAGHAVLGVLAIVDLQENAQPLPTAELDSAAIHAALWQWRNAWTLGAALARLAGVSPAARRVRAQVQAAAACAAPVLLVGPAGCDSAGVARGIFASRRAKPGAEQPVELLIPLDCRLATPELLQAAIASAGEPPAARRALLLMDIDQASGELQLELERVLGSAADDWMVFATAQTPLRALATAGAFRVRLAETVSVLVIDLPSLTSRPGDIPYVAQALLEEINGEAERQLAGLTPEAIELLAASDWPGDLEELAAAMRAAHRQAELRHVTVRDLPARLTLAREAARAPRALESIRLGEFLRQVEREAIRRALDEVRGNKSRAARLLGLTRPRLYRRMVQLGLEPPPDGEGAKEPPP